MLNITACITYAQFAHVFLCLLIFIPMVHLGYGIRSLMLSSLPLTFIVSLDFILKEVALAIPEDKGKERKDECIQDADDGQDVGPAH